MIYTTLDSFYVSEEELVNSPSAQDGVDPDMEAKLRYYGCDLIQTAGILLRLPQAAMATGQVVLHRFYCKQSLARWNVKTLAMASVWLAAKLEESPRKIRDVLCVFHRIEQRRTGGSVHVLDMWSEQYEKSKSEVIRAERHILKEMGFIAHVEHPHKFVISLIQTLNFPPELRQPCWNMVNDSLRTSLCVRYKTEVVACGVIYLAARQLQVPLPEDPPWWLLFNTDRTQLEDVCRVLLKMYAMPKPDDLPLVDMGAIPLSFGEVAKASTAFLTNGNTTPVLPSSSAAQRPEGTRSVAGSEGGSIHLEDGGAQAEGGTGAPDGNASEKRASSTESALQLERESRLQPAEGPAEVDQLRQPGASSPPDRDASRRKSVEPSQEGEQDRTRESRDGRRSSDHGLDRHHRHRDRSHSTGHDRHRDREVQERSRGVHDHSKRDYLRDRDRHARDKGRVFNRNCRAEGGIVDGLPSSTATVASSMFRCSSMLEATVEGLLRPQGSPEECYSTCMAARQVTVHAAI
eukprot:jgi/Chlat1/7653/Chrsp64S07168